MNETGEVIIEHDLDAAHLYDEARRRFVALMSQLDAGALTTPVPPTPAWTAQDVLAHVVGITADLNALRFGDGDADDWTAHQVATRRGRTVAELADEWEREAPQFVEGLYIFGYELGSHYVGDLLQHEADVRYAVGAEPIPDDDALAAGLDFYLDHLHGELGSESIGTLTVEVPGESFVVGAGAPAASVRGSRFELFRAIGGRRSERQIKRLDWSGAADHLVPHLSAYPPLPAHDLVEQAPPPRPTS